MKGFKFIILAIFLLISVITPVVLAQQPTFLIDDVFPYNNNATVRICSNSNTTVTNSFSFNSTFRNSLTNVTIINATITQCGGSLHGAQYNSSNVTGNLSLVSRNVSGECPSAQQIRPIFQAPFPQCADFVLDISWSDTNQTMNVTALNDTLSGGLFNPVSMNTSVVTLNQFILKTQDIGGSTVGNVILMGWNDTRQSYADYSRGPALSASDGYFLQHCRGTVLANNGTCIGQSSFHPRNQCMWHGINFFSFESGGGAGIDCLSLNNTRFIGFDFISSNTTNNTLFVNKLSTFTLNKSSSVSFANVFGVNMNNPFGGGPVFVNLSAVRVFDTTGSLTYSQTLSANEAGFVPPFFIDVNRPYTIELTIGNDKFNYSFVSPSTGMFGAVIMIPNGTTSYTIVKGQVVNESNVAQGVAGAVVYAKFHEFFSPPMGISFVNSTTTDSKGLFTLRLPTTSFQADPFSGFVRPFPEYDLYVVATNTSGAGVPLFFPTVEANDDRGSIVQGIITALRPIKMKAGGQVSVNVSVGNSSGLLSELNKFDANKATGEVISDSTSKMSMIDIFEGSNPPSTVNVPLLSPTGNVVFTILGQRQVFGFGDAPINGICINYTNVNQGASSPMTCNLTNPGYLNLSVINCNSIFNPSTCTQQEQLGSFHPWFENKLVVTNTTNTLMHIRGGSFLLENLLRSGTSWSNISLPLPAGTYTISFVPSFEFSRFTSVENSTSFTITAGQITTLNLRRGQGFQIEPRFPAPALSANNSINITVRDPSTFSVLTNNNVSAQVTLLFRNKTAASVPIYLTYDAGSETFGNTTVNFSARWANRTVGTGILKADKYFMYINVTNVSTTATRYTSTMLMPTSLSDFSVGVDLGGFTFGTGQFIRGKVFAFDTTTSPPTAKTGNVTVKILDLTGTLVNSTVGPVTSGEGTFSVLAPSTIGFYPMVVLVNSTDNKTGNAEMFFQVSNLATKVSTDRFSYATSDNVIVSVEVRNASSGAGISDASVEVTVDSHQNPVSSITDSGGKATVTLNPTTVTGSTWSFGFHSIKVKISKDTPTQVINLETFYGFEARGLELFVEPEKPSYSISEAVKVKVFTPPGTSLTGNPTAILDGQTNVTYQASQLAPNFYQFNFGTQTTGRHNVQISASTSSGTQTVFTGFEVIATNILVETRRGSNVQFVFDANELLNLTVTVINATNGSVVPNQAVEALLYKVSPPNDINITRNVSTTNAAGFANMTLNVSNRGGPHYIQVSVGGQKQYVGVMVSSLAVSLMNATPGSTGAAIVSSFSATPGSTVNIFVNASSAGSNVADGSLVTLRLWAFGRPIEITNTTTSGNSSLSFAIPSFAPRLTYGLDVSVTTTSSSIGFAPPAALTVTGSAALKLGVEPNRHSYTTGSSGSVTAVLTYENGTAALGHNITFERGLPGTSAIVIGTAITSSTGAATVSPSSMGTSDGEYFVHAFVTNESTVSAYSGYTVSSLNVSLVTNKTSYNIGEGIGFSVTVRNASTGLEINASTGTGFVMVFDRDRGLVTVPLTVGNDQPYTANLSIPNESAAIGTYGVGAEFTYNGSKGFAFTLLSIRNASATVNLDIPSNITAGTAFNATIKSPLTATGALTVFSPAATSVVYDNTSITMTGGTAQNISLTLSDTGVYVFLFRVEGVGDNSTVSTIKNVTSGAVPAVWTGSSLTANSTSFSSGSTVFILSNVANSTATVLTISGNVTVTTSLPLTQTSGSNFYTTLTPSSTGTYYVRLDKSTASAMANSMFVVT